MGWGQGWGEATERLLKDCVLGVSLPTLVLALDRGVWLQSLTICPWDRAVTPLRQPLHPRAGCHPSNGGPSGRAVCPPCLPPPTGPWLGAAPRLTPKPRRPAVKEGKVGVPGFGGRARGHLTCRRIVFSSRTKAAEPGRRSGGWKGLMAVRWMLVVSRARSVRLDPAEPWLGLQEAPGAS